MVISCGNSSRHPLRRCRQNTEAVQWKTDQLLSNHPPSPVTTAHLLYETWMGRGWRKIKENGLLVCLTNYLDARGVSARRMAYYEHRHNGEVVYQQLIHLPGGLCTDAWETWMGWTVLHFRFEAIKEQNWETCTTGEWTTPYGVTSTIETIEMNKEGLDFWYGVNWADSAWCNCPVS